MSERERFEAWVLGPARVAIFYLDPDDEILWDDGIPWVVRSGDKVFSVYDEWQAWQAATVGKTK